MPFTEMEPEEREEQRGKKSKFAFAHAKLKTLVRNPYGNVK